MSLHHKPKIKVTHYWKIKRGEMFFYNHIINLASSKCFYSLKQM